MKEFPARVDRIHTAVVCGRHLLFGGRTKRTQAGNILLTGPEERSQSLWRQFFDPATVAVLPGKGVEGELDLAQYSGMAVLNPLQQGPQCRVPGVSRRLVPRFTVLTALGVEPLNVAHEHPA